MSGKRYPEEFKIKAVKQVTERGHSFADLAARIGVSVYSLYDWIKRYEVPEAERTEQQGTERRNPLIEGRIEACHRGARHPKKAAAYFAKESR